MSPVVRLIRRKLDVEAEHEDPVEALKAALNGLATFGTFDYAKPEYEPIAIALSKRIHATDPSAPAVWRATVVGRET